MGTIVDATTSTSTVLDLGANVLDANRAAALATAQAGGYSASAQTAATQAAQSASSILSAMAAGTVRSFPTPAAALANGIIGYSFVPGTAGTDGSYALAFMGGSGQQAAASILVAGGAISTLTPQSPGYGYTSTPLVSFTVAGLTGASITAQIGPNTTDGQYFIVPDPAYGSMLVYQNVAGAAIFQFRLNAGIADTVGLLLSGYRYVYYGQDGNSLFAVDDGAYPGFVVSGLKEMNPEQFPKQGMNLGGTMVNYPAAALYATTGYRKVQHGPDGALWYGVDDSAYPRFVVPSLLEVDPARYAKTAQNLGGQVSNYLSQKDLMLSGYGHVLVDDSGNLLAGISDDPLPVPHGAWSPFRHANSEVVSDPSAGYELFTRRDANNFMQVYSRSLTTFAVTQLSNPGVDNINPHFDVTRTRAMWTTSAKDKWPSNRLRSRNLSGAGKAAHAYPARILTVTSDSIGAGAGAAPVTNGFTYLSATANGLTMNMQGIGGQQEWQQGMIMGAIPTILTLSDTSITTAAISVTAIATIHPTSGTRYGCNVQPLNGTSLYPNTLLLSTAADANGRTLNGWVTDASGHAQYVVLTRTATGTPSTLESYTIASLTGVAITLASTEVTFVPDKGDQPASVMPNQHNNVMLYEGGINDLNMGMAATNIVPPSAASIVADIAAVQDAIIAKNASGVQAFIVVGIYNIAYANFAAGTAADLAIISYNAGRKAKYPGRFLDAFSILAVANDGSAQDLSDVANHYIPTSLTVDGTHPNNTGHAALSNGNSGGVGAKALIAAQIAALPSS